MRCRFCRTRSVEVFLRMYNLPLCRDHFISFFYKRIRETIEKYKMFGLEDKVVVAVSGGKDSLALALALKDLGYSVIGYFLDLGIPEGSAFARETVIRFGEKFSIPVHVEELRSVFGYSLVQISEIMRRPACSFCGTLKRYYMNRFARSIGADVLCTGHTMFDEATVLFSNVLQWKEEYLFRQLPVLPEEQGLTKKAKPLAFITERETAIYCFFKGIDYLDLPCPLSSGAKSRRVKLRLLQLEEDSPGTINRFLKGFYSFKKKINFSSFNKEDIQPCRECGYPTTADRFCSVCRMKRKLSENVSRG